MKRTRTTGLLALLLCAGLVGAGVILARAAESWHVPLTATLHAPRAVAAGGGRLYVLDGQGWLRILDYDGNLLGERQLVKTARGFPAGVFRKPDGTILVADTHESRVLRLSADGEVLGTFCGGHGSGPGQFIYPQRFALIGDEVFVTEYGFDTNDRVQVFGPDGAFLRTFGTFGFEGGRFARPCGIAVGPGGDVYVADSSHRVLRWTADGRFVSEFGEEGREPGRLTYPYGMVSDREHLYVVEYGTHRISRFTFDGAFRGCIGGNEVPHGFLFPRDLALADGYLFVADTGNHRVVRLRLSEVPWEGAP